MPPADRQPIVDAIKRLLIRTVQEMLAARGSR
jgi:hypothetical protein